MSSNAGGSNFDPSNIADAVHQHLLGTLFNAGLQTVTLGAAGYNSSTGMLDEGGQTHAIDEGVGQLTGRNAGRDAQGAAEAALNAADAAQAQSVLDTQAKNKANDIAASTQAGAIRTAANANSQAVLNGFTANPNADVQNFLGL
jgi:hypothetical protein